MHEYDTVLKLLLTGSEHSVLQRITGNAVADWLNVELPDVRQLRVDLLGRTASGGLLNLELQSSNDPHLPLRMAEYALGVYRTYGQFPRQFVLYVGQPEMRMASELAGEEFVCRYTLFDIRTIDEEMLLNSSFATDNLLAILSRHRDRRETIRRILGRIATLKKGARDQAFAKLLILGGLRRLGDSIRKEVKDMPILDDIMDHDVIGPAIRQGIQQGRQEGLQEGRREGQHREALAILRGQIARRFGGLPAELDERLANLGVAELEDLAFRLIEARSIRELFAKTDSNSVESL